MAATTFLLIRHGDTGVRDRISGRTPGIALSERGRAEVEALCRRLEDVPLHALYASPLQRTLETAARVAHRAHLGIRVLEDVQEVDYGEWTGRSFEELAREQPQRAYNAFCSGTRIPSGESMLDVQARMVAALDRLRERHPGACVVVVSHGDPIKSVIAHHTGMSVDHLSRFEISTGSINVLRVGGDFAKILLLNDSGALPDVLSR